MSARIVGQEVWDALVAEGVLVGQSEVVQQTLRTCVDQIPRILSFVLRAQATMPNLLEARIRMLQCRREIETQMSAVPHTANALLDERIAQYEHELQEALRLLAQTGSPEKEEALIAKMGLNPMLMDLYRHKLLLVEDVLRKQPSVILLDQS